MKNFFAPTVHRLGQQSARLLVLPLLLLAALLCVVASPCIAGQTYYVKTNGVDRTFQQDPQAGTSSKPWKTLKYACLQVAPNQGNTIKLGPGTFTDLDRGDTTKVPATLPRNVSLIGSGKTSTTYVGTIKVPSVSNQRIAEFFLDGRENTNSRSFKFEGIYTGAGDRLTIEDMRVEGFWGSALRLGYKTLLTHLNLRRCELINNGNNGNRDGFAMRISDLEDSNIYENTFREEHWKGGEIWNSGGRSYTRVKIYNNTFETSRDPMWKDQEAFNIELVGMDCREVEIFGNTFDGTVSLVDKADQPNQNKLPYSVRVHDNKWLYTTRYCIEASMASLQIDNNYFHFDLSDDDDEQGGGYAALANFGTAKHNNVRVFRNVFDNVPQWCIYNLVGDNIQIYNNTATGGRPGRIPSSTAGVTPRFIHTDEAPAPRSNWKVVNNVFDCDSGRPGKFWGLSNTTPPSNSLVKNNLIHNAEVAMSPAFLAQTNVDAPIIANAKLSLTGDRPSPYFTALPGSPLIDKGRIVAGITDDYQGNAPDIGRYESAGSGSGGGNPGSVVTIATENFESGNWSGGTGWSQSSWSVTSPAAISSYAYQGSYSGQIKNAGSSIARKVNLSGYHNVTIELVMDTHVFETGDRVYVKFWNGASWKTLKSVASLAGWTTYSFDLSDQTMVGTGQEFRLNSGMVNNSNSGFTDTEDLAYIDSIVIKGIPN